MNWWTQNAMVDPIGSNLEALLELDDQYDEDEDEMDEQPIEVSRAGLNMIRAHVRAVLLGEKWASPGIVADECHAVSLVVADPDVCREFDEYGEAMREMEACV